MTYWLSRRLTDRSYPWPDHTLLFNSTTTPRAMAVVVPTARIDSLWTIAFHPRFSRLDRSTSQ